MYLYTVNIRDHGMYLGSSIVSGCDASRHPGYSLTKKLSVV